ncbi:unnamed protein product, partial [Porites evermanni]
NAIFRYFIAEEKVLKIQVLSLYEEVINSEQSSIEERSSTQGDGYVMANQMFSLSEDVVNSEQRYSDESSTTQGDG